MIRRDIQDSADLWVEVLDGLQLEAADLRSDHAIVGHLQRLLGVGGSDITHHEDLRVIALENLSHQGCCCSFSVCSGNGRNFALAKMVSQLHLTPDGCAVRAQLLHQRQIHRHARA